MDVTAPEISTTALMTTLPLSKSRKSSSEATAVAARSNFGGTNPDCCSKFAVSSLGFGVGWTAKGFAGEAMEADFVLGAGRGGDAITLGPSFAVVLFGGLSRSIAFGNAVCGVVDGLAGATASFPAETFAVWAPAGAGLGGAGIGAAKGDAEVTPPGSELTAIFVEGCIQGSHCLYHDRAISAASVSVSSVMRSNAARNAGVNCPRARNDRLGLGSEI